MATELKPIIIDNFQKGMAKSPFIGHSVMCGMNIGIGGSLNMSNNFILDSAVAFDATEYPIAKDGIYWMTTKGTGLLYNYFYVGATPVKQAGYTKTGYSGGDVKVYNSKVYITNSSGYVSVYDIGATTFAIDAYTLPNGAGKDFLPMIVGSDDILYFGAGQTISSYNNSSFTATACTIPTGRVITALLQYGDNILIATESTTYEGNIKIYTWNRQSNLADLWLEIKERNFINFGVNNGMVYILCGESASLYSSVGTTANKLVSFGDYVRSDAVKYNNNLAAFRRWGETDIMSGSFYILQDKVLFAPILTNAYQHPFGIMSYDITKRTVGLEFTTGTSDALYTAGNNTRNISLIFMDSSYYLYFFYIKKNGSTGDTYKAYKTLLTSSSRVDSSQGSYYESPFYQIGTSLQKRTISTLTIKLSRPIISTEEIQVFYRVHSNGAWVGLGSFNTTGQISKEFPLGVSGENIQIRCIVYQGSYSATYAVYPTPELLQIILK